MSLKPTFKIYNQANTSLIYQIENVLYTNWPVEQSSGVEITNLRSAGAIFIPGGNKPYDIELRGVLTASNYEALTAKIFALKDTVLLNTKYKFRADKTSTTYDTINVIRKEAIDFESSKRFNIQYFTIRLRANSWA